MEDRRRDKLSRFIESFPTKQQLNNTESRSYPHRRVFLTQINYADDDVKKKVISAFSNVNVPRIKGLLQFWAPVPDAMLLSTFHQPFALENFDPALKRYRLSCLNYYYGLDDNVFQNDHKQIGGSGLIAAAFVNGFPDVVLDLRLYKGTSPLVDIAIDCGLTCCILIPVFHHSSSCVGVVECCLKVPGLLVIFKELKRALESAGLLTFNIHECLLYNNSTQRVFYETQAALKIVCESLQLSVAQVWIPFRENETHVPFPGSSSSCMETTSGGGGFAVKLCGYCVDYDDDDDIKTYYNTCDVLPLKTDVGLVGKTHETNKAYLCMNLRKLKLKGLFGLLSRNTESTCLTICMRSINTGYDVHYAFEFLWPKSRDFVIIMESLFLTLKKCLPCFEFAQQQLMNDDHVRVLLVDDSSLNEVGSIDISQEENKTSTHLQRQPAAASTALEQGTKLVKRKKFSYLFDHEFEIESDSDSEYWGVVDDDVHVIADSGGITKMFTLQSTYTLENANDKVEEAFKLDPGTYSLECQLNEKEMILNTDQDLSSCIELWRSLQSGPKSYFNVRVILKSQQRHQQQQQQHDMSLLSSMAIIQKYIEEEEQQQQRVQKPSGSIISRRVFWSQFECTSSSDAAAASNWVIHEKIKHSFLSCADSLPSKGIIFQFWAPLMSTDGSWLLSTYDQPFALAMLNTRIRRYRLSCHKYQHSIVHQQPEEVVEKEDHLPGHKVIINGGPHATAFLNGFPEVVVDMVHNKWKGNQLLDCALKYELTCSVMLPVFYQGSTSCVGVVECSMQRSSGLLVMFNDLTRALEKVGLSIYHVNKESSPPPPPPYKSMQGLKPAVDEIEVALKMVVESHDLTLGQVWIPFSSSTPSPMVVDDMDDREGMFLFKLNGYSVDYCDDPLSRVKDFYDIFNVLPLKRGEGLAGKTLETYRPHLCTRNHLANLTCDNHGGLLSLLSANTTHHHSCLVICLRSVHTGDDVDLVFEFLWPANRNHVILMNSMISKVFAKFHLSFLFYYSWRSCTRGC